MSLKDQLNADYKEAMKAKDKVRKETINFVKAAIKQFEVDNREEIDDAGINAILSKQVKMRKDALDEFKEAGRDDLLEQYNSEIAILEAYLPEQLSDEKIAEIVAETAAELDIKQGDGKSAMGKLMGPVMAKVKGIADGKKVNAAVLKYLG